MSNIYTEYFETLRQYLITLHIDEARKGVERCSEDQIATLKKIHGELPAAYEAYLRTIGKRFLFEFMDAEDMSFEDMEYIQKFGSQVFNRNKFTPSKKCLVISERRNDFISLIYTGTDDPRVWIMSEYWDEEEKEENLAVRSESFTGLMNSFLKKTLVNFPLGFNFIPSTVEDKEKYFRNKMNAWLRGIKELKESIDKTPTINPLVIELNEIISDYYERNKQSIDKKGFRIGDVVNMIATGQQKKKVISWLLDIFK